MECYSKKMFLNREAVGIAFPLDPGARSEMMENSPLSVIARFPLSESIVDSPSLVNEIDTVVLSPSIIPRYLLSTFGHSIKLLVFLLLYSLFTCKENEHYATGVGGDLM